VLSNSQVTIDLAPNALPCLEMMELDEVIWPNLDDSEGVDSGELRSFFSPTHLPALNHLVLGARAVEQDGPLYDTLLPQLTHLHYDSAADIESILPQLQLCASLKSLWITCHSFELKDLSLNVMDFFKTLNLEEFRFRSNMVGIHPDDDEWQTAFPPISKLVELVEEMNTIKKLSLGLFRVSDYEARTDEWKKFKEDVRKRCAKKSIQIVPYDEYEDFERDDLAWID
jgi:hypothetical protein